MTVNLHQEALHRLLETREGAVGRLIAGQAEQVRQVAELNASGVFLNRQSGQLLDNLVVEVSEGPLRATVSTSANREGFSYPAYWDRRGRPWLTQALAVVFGPAD